MEERRLSVVISKEDQIRLRNLIPWGLAGKIMRILLLQTLDLIEKHGEIVIGAILSKSITISDIVEHKKEYSHGTDTTKTTAK